MSIVVHVEPYCENCPAFTPKVKSDILYGEDREFLRDTRITCEKAKHCSFLVDYLRRSIERDEA